MDNMSDRLPKRNQEMRAKVQSALQQGRPVQDHRDRAGELFPDVDQKALLTRHDCKAVD